MEGSQVLNRAIRSFVLQFSGSILGFLFQFLTAKLLGAEEYGKFSYYFGLIGTIGVFFFLGISYYLPRHIHAYAKGETLLSKLLSLYVILVLALSPIIIYIIHYYVEDWTIITLIFAGVLGFSLIEILRAYYVAVFKPEKGAFLKSFLMNLLAIGLFFVLYLKEPSASYTLMAMVGAHLVIVIPFAIKNFKPKKVEMSLVKGLLPFYLVQVLYTTYVHFSKVLQGEVGTYEIVGILSISVVVSKVITMLAVNFSYVVMPEFSKAWKENNKPLINSLFKRIARLNIFVLTPVVVFLFINSQRVLDVLGEGYQNGDLILKIILVGSIFTAFVGPNGAVLLMTGNQKYEIFNGLLLTITGLSLGLLLGEQYMFGIAISIAASEIVVALSKRFLTFKLLKISPYTLKVILFLLGFLVLETAVFLSTRRIGNLLLWISLNGLIIAFFILSKFLMSPEKEDSDYLKSNYAKLISKIK